MLKLSLSLCFSMAWSLSVAQPINDNPCGAIPLTVDESCNFSYTNTFGATSSGIPSPGCGSTFKDVWFSITVPESGMFTVETIAGTITDAALAIYTEPCTDPLYTFCDDDSGPGNMPMISLTGFIPGSTAYIRFYKKGGGSGTFSICIWDDNPPLVENDDCENAHHLCTELSFDSNSDGNGDVDDLDASNKGCLTTNEHQSSWYYITFAHPGEFGLEIDPINDDDNYNFALWGPNVTCNDLGDPLRCSYATTDGSTGMQTGSTDESEGVLGDGWVKHITANTGDTYIFMIDNYSESGDGFTFEFQGPPTIDCIDYLLPVILNSFTGFDDGTANVLYWTTSSEIDNDYFLIERSANGYQFSSIGKVDGAGTTTITTNYKFIDESPFNGNSYYRLKQVDHNGDYEYSEVIQISNVTISEFAISPNPSHGIVYINHNQNPGAEYSIEVVSGTGSKYMTITNTAETEFVQDKIIITNQGIYWIIIRSAEGMNALKVVIE